jgi:hypothetical protein
MVNKRFLVAPVIALAACTMLVPEAQSRGFRGGFTPPMSYHFPVHQPNMMSKPSGAVNHQGMTHKNGGAINHRPTTTLKPQSGANHPKGSQGGKMNPPSAATSRLKGGPAGTRGPQDLSVGGDFKIKGKGIVVSGDGSNNINNSPGATLNNNSNNKSLTNNFGSAGQGWGTWGGWFQLPSSAAAGSGGMPPSINVMSPPGGAPIVEPQDMTGVIQELGRFRGRQSQSEEKESEGRSPGSPEQKRQLSKMDELRRSLNPPKHEIYSALALNTLLDDLQGFQALGGQGPPVALDADLLRHFNVIWKQDTGNIGLLKNEGRLTWPVALRTAEHQEPRDALNVLVPQAIKQAVRGGVEADTLGELKAALGKLNGQLSANIAKLPAPRHIEAKRFLGQLDDALKVLAKPHAGDYFSGKFSAQGNSIADLVQHMTRHGLKFAPAVTGDETAYEGLHRALAVYDVAAHTSRTE